MKKIFKYELEITDFQEIEMPIGALVISAKEQNGKLCIWAEVDLRIKTTKSKKIAIVGTGNPVEFSIGVYDYSFVDTVIMSYGLVWHVYVFNNLPHQ